MNWTQGLSEIVLLVEDVPKAAKFYSEIVGLNPVNPASENWAWFWTGEPEKSAYLAVHKGKLLFEEHSALPEGQRFGRIHYAFRIQPQDLEPAGKKLEEAGVKVYGPVRLDWMKATSIYFYDPDQNLLEFCAFDNTGTMSRQ
ncbi:MAG: VOC family protein [Armatimonadetes bacterium]|nr:VOC family protein [Armatimonadota bacterium]